MEIIAMLLGTRGIPGEPKALETRPNDSCAPKSRSGLMLSAAVAALAFGLFLSTPLTADLGATGAITLDLKAAYAKGGNGGGNGGGNRGSNGAAGSYSANGNGKGAMASTLGSLNAAHASSQAFDHANRNSRVGALADYMDAMTDYRDAIADLNAYMASLAVGEEPEADLLGPLEAAVDEAFDRAVGSLEDAANKDSLIDADVVHAVNEMLNGKSADFSHENLDGDAIHDSETAVAGAVNPPVE
jgi:hypothetical protein